MTMERAIRTSAKALVIREGKMLALRMQDADGEFFIMPGGGQHAGETLDKACEREVMEETGILVKAKDAVFIIEGAKGESFHRVDIVFACEYLGEDDSGERIEDNGQKGVSWLPLENLNLQPLYPSRLRRAIMNFEKGAEAPVYLGNENMGDPEITE